jgi:hypothetical protein
MQRIRVCPRVVFSVLSAALCCAAGAAEPAAKEPPKLVIVKAVYGDHMTGKTADVTEKLQALVKPEGLTVEVSNANFGDPAEGVRKQLKVEYTVDGQKLERTVGEYETLTISLKPTKLVIEKAVYGDLPNGASADVTARVREMVKDDSLSVVANGQFGDPAEGVGKKLKVDYAFDGVKKSKEVNEGETLTISNQGE